MKVTPHLIKRPSGFTLIEILVVIAIIAVLATMTISGIGYYNNKVSKSRTTILFGQIESSLEQYRADIGEYPISKAANPLTSSDILYIALYGDGIGKDGIAGTSDDTQPDGIPAPEATIYLDALNPKNRGKSLNLVYEEGEILYLIADGWGDRIGYRCIPEGSPELMNPPTSFDLWSAGGEGSIDQNTTINNWK